MNLNLKLKKNNAQPNSSQSKGVKTVKLSNSVKKTKSSQPLVIFGQKIDSIFLKREWKFFIEFVKEKKSAKILLGTMGGIFLLSFIGMFFLVGAPLIITLPLFMLIFLMLLGGFFIEIILLNKKQFLTGVYLLDLVYTIQRKISEFISKQFKKPKKEIKMPWLLSQFKNILRFTFPFFKRITREQFNKLSKNQQEQYMKKYNIYLKKTYQK